MTSFTLERFLLIILRKMTKSKHLFLSTRSLRRLMKVLDRLPIADEHFLLNVHGEPLRLRPFLIIIQVSISPFRQWDSRTPVIPALLDSGNNHNLSIQEHHLRQWAGIHSGALPSL